MIKRIQQPSNIPPRPAPPPAQPKKGGLCACNFLEKCAGMEQRIVALEAQIQGKQNTVYIGIDESIPQMIDNLAECLIKKIREERGENDGSGKYTDQGFS